MRFNQIELKEIHREHWYWSHAFTCIGRLLSLRFYDFLLTTHTMCAWEINIVLWPQHTATTTTNTQKSRFAFQGVLVFFLSEIAFRHGSASWNQLSLRSIDSLARHSIWLFFVFFFFLIQLCSHFTHTFYVNPRFLFAFERERNRFH